MKRIILAVIFGGSLAFSVPASAQYESVVMEGELGISLGGAHYFGDLNTKAKLNRPKLAFGAFFRKQFGNYIGVRVSGNYARIGYSDIYNTHNDYQKRRNLSFNSNIFELALQGDFNFFKFVTGDPDHRFTPYVTLGVGVFSYDPYAYLNNEKIFLRPLGTEGQGTTAYPDRKPYGTMIGRTFRLCGATGVITKLPESGNTIGPLQLREYPVEPVGVDTITPSAQ